MEKKEKYYKKMFPTSLNCPCGMLYKTADEKRMPFTFTSQTLRRHKTVITRRNSLPTPMALHKKAQITLGSLIDTVQ